MRSLSRNRYSQRLDEHRTTISIQCLASPCLHMTGHTRSRKKARPQSPLTTAGSRTGQVPPLGNHIVGYGQPEGVEDFLSVAKALLLLWLQSRHGLQIRGMRGDRFRRRGQIFRDGCPLYDAQRNENQAIDDIFHSCYPTNPINALR